MLQRILGLSCLVSLLALSSFAQDFSADVVNAQHEKGGMQKMYATKDKIRFDVGSDDARMGPTSLIFDEGQNKYFAVMSARHMYMEAPRVMTRQVVSRFFRVQDVNDACPQWKKAAEDAGTAQDWGSCTKVGSDTVNGRSAVKYEGTSKKGEKMHVWVDTKLHCVIKTEDKGGSNFELRNIQEGSQPSSLFEIPAGYTKFDLGAMMQQQQ